MYLIANISVYETLLRSFIYSLALRIRLVFIDQMIVQGAYCESIFGLGVNSFFMFLMWPCCVKDYLNLKRKWYRCMIEHHQTFCRNIYRVFWRRTYFFFLYQSDHLGNLQKRSSNFHFTQLLKVKVLIFIYYDVKFYHLMSVISEKMSSLNYILDFHHLILKSSKSLENNVDQD